MRLNFSALGLLLPVAALLSGCAMQNSGSVTSAVVSAKAIRGKAYGGQNPVSSGTIGLYAFGTGGYGSAPTLLASTVADSTGYFNIDPSTITCPTPTTPVYILSIGGNPGFGNNSAIVLGSGIGNCADAANAFVTINEISTAMMAYTFAHFFSATPTADVNTPDHFGGPADATQTIMNGNNGTLFTLLDVENGYPRVNNSTVTFEGNKLITLGNILGACVNSVGPGSPSCNALFSYITGPNGAVPTTTLEAAVYLALNPQQNVGYVFALQPQSGAAAFTGGLTAPPNDWTLSASYTTPNFGLAVNTRTVSTIDIDLSGRVWFPSNAAGKGGVGYFDPSDGTFSPVFSAGLVHPQEVAIDIDGEVWANDMNSSIVAGFPAANPGGPVVLSLPNTTSTAVTIAYDNSVRYGIVDGNGLPALAQVQGKSAYTPVPNTEIPGAYGYIASSLAADVVGGFGIGGQELDTPTTFDLYLSPSGQTTEITYQSFEDSGQVGFTSNDYVGARGGYAPGDDGICIWSAQNCFSMANDAVRHPSGLSIDGAGSLWLTDTNGPTIEQIPLVNGSYLNGSNQANNVVYDHSGANGGGTLSAPAGVAVDRAGNIWISNYGCHTTGCTPGSFTLSEIIGGGAPTITPVSRQIVIDDLAGTQPQVKKAGTVK